MRTRGGSLVARWPHLPPGRLVGAGASQHHRVDKQGAHSIIVGGRWNNILLVAGGGPNPSEMLGERFRVLSCVRFSSERSVQAGVRAIVTDAFGPILTGSTDSCGIGGRDGGRRWSGGRVSIRRAFWWRAGPIPLPGSTSHAHFASDRISCNQWWAMPDALAV